MAGTPILIIDSEAANRNKICLGKKQKQACSTDHHNSCRLCAKMKSFFLKRSGCLAL